MRSSSKKSKKKIVKYGKNSVVFKRIIIFLSSVAIVTYVGVQFLSPILARGTQVLGESTSIGAPKPEIGGPQQNNTGSPSLGTNLNEQPNGDHAPFPPRGGGQAQMGGPQQGPESGQQQAGHEPRGVGEAGMNGQHVGISEIGQNPGRPGQAASGSGIERTPLNLNQGGGIFAAPADGGVQFDLASQGFKTKFDFQDGQMVLKAQNSDGQETEIDQESALPQIEKRLDANGIGIATDGGKFVLSQSGTSAKTTFPVSIDFSSNTLYIDTPAGQQEITVLPDNVVKSLISRKIFSQVSDGTKTADPITLSQSNGQPVYQIKGTEDKKFFGIIPIKVSKDVTVSATTGQVEGNSQSFFNRVLDTLSL
ncbi:MAG TPA: hypothetical protein VG965_03430 [Patescibacteria group bacterium]|nr:hypothetical protein [Patescibacteria group bacterium]